MIFYFLGHSGADHTCTCSRKAAGLGDQGSPALPLAGCLTVGQSFTYLGPPFFPHG